MVACIYALQHIRFFLLFIQRSLEQIIINKPDDPLSFLIDNLKKEDDDGKNELRLISFMNGTIQSWK